MARTQTNRQARRTLDLRLRLNRHYPAGRHWGLVMALTQSPPPRLLHCNYRNPLRRRQH